MLDCSPLFSVSLVLISCAGLLRYMLLLGLVDARYLKSFCAGFKRQTTEQLLLVAEESNAAVFSSCIVQSVLVLNVLFNEHVCECV